MHIIKANSDVMFWGHNFIADSPKWHWDLLAACKNSMFGWASYSSQIWVLWISRVPLAKGKHARSAWLTCKQKENCPYPMSWKLSPVSMCGLGKRPQRITRSPFRSLRSQADCDIWRTWQQASGGKTVRVWGQTWFSVATPECWWVITSTHMFWDNHPFTS